MAKLKAPLLSLGASGKLADALVYFPWKGLNVVREYVIPSNPQTALQTTQRGFMTGAVAWIHAHQADATHPIDAEDVMAYAALAGTRASPRTWFNEAIKFMLDNRRLNPAYRYGSYGDGHLTPGVGTLTFETWFYFTHAITAATLFYGTSPTALVHSIALVVAANKLSVPIPALTAGVKYYAQVRPTAPANTVAIRSGIYYGYPT